LSWGFFNEHRDRESKNAGRRRPVLGALIDRLGSETRRWFTAGYLNDENVSFGSPVYRPAMMIEQDNEVVAYLHRALALSRHAKGH